MIHCRPSENGGSDAHDEMINILSSYKLEARSQKLVGNIHFFTGTKEIAEKYFELGFSVSIPGVVTFSNEVAKVVKELPIERILAETDCPYAAPTPHRGKRNEPIFVIYTIRKIAELKQLPLEDVRECFLNNAKASFSL